MTRAESIPVHVLTGFLGSGKTTLLNRALAAGLGSETAVVVNEFGNVGLDQFLIQEHCEETVVLKSGCICCSVRSDIVSTLMHIARLKEGGRQQLRRVVVETSGLSDPLPILTTLQSDLNLLRRFHVGSVLCTVDATSSEATLRPEGLAQIAAADACVVTKRDLVTSDQAAAAAGLVARINPVATGLCSGSDTFSDWLRSYERGDLNGARPALHPTAPAPQPAVGHHGVSSFVLYCPNPRSWAKFAVWLSAVVFQHGDRILRLKGIIHDAQRGTWIGVNGVRRFLHRPEHLTLSEPPSSGACLVFITDGLRAATIERSYLRFVAGVDSRVGRPPEHVCTDAASFSARKLLTYASERSG